MEEQQSRETRSCLAWFCYRTWYPFKTLRSVLVLSSILGAFFIVMAVAQLAMYSKTHEYEVMYASNEGCL
jgi:hypothetical protein